MKKIILYLLVLVSIIIIISEIKTITIGIITTKVISLLYLYLFAKANNYFYN